MNKNLLHLGILSIFSVGCCGALVAMGETDTSTTTTNTAVVQTATTATTGTVASTGTTATSSTGTTTSAANTTVTAVSSDITLPDGTLIKTPDDPKIYVIKDGKKVWIQSPKQFKEMGYKWQDVKVVSKEAVENVKNTVKTIENKTDKKVYQLVNGKLIWVPTVAAFNAQGLKWGEVTELSNATTQYPEARYIKDSKGNVYYITNSGKKKLIVNQDVLNSYGVKAEDIVQVSDEIINSIPTVNLEKTETDAKVYVVENGQKKWIKTATDFAKRGFNWLDIETVTQSELDAYHTVE